MDEWPVTSMYEKFNISHPPYVRHHFHLDRCTRENENFAQTDAVIQKANNHTREYFLRNLATDQTQCEIYKVTWTDTNNQNVMTVIYVFWKLTRTARINIKLFPVTFTT